MTNPLTNHVDPHRSEAQEDLMVLLRRDEQIAQLYRPVLELMGL